VFFQIAVQQREGVRILRANSAAKNCRIAEKLESRFGTLTMTVVKPDENTAAAIKSLHSKFMRRCLDAKDRELAGIWTIERGEQFGRLHVNYLTSEAFAEKSGRGAKATAS